MPSAGAGSITSPHLPHPAFGGTPGLVTTHSIPSNQGGPLSHHLEGRTNPNPPDPMSNRPPELPNNGDDSANKKSITIYSIQLFHTYSTGSASALLGCSELLGQYSPTEDLSMINKRTDHHKSGVYYKIVYR